MARKEFDWIDDAFDDKKTAEDMEKASGTGVAAVLLIVVIILAAMLTVFAIVGILGSLQVS